jgi:antirestriction protein ArdC
MTVQSDVPIHVSGRYRAPQLLIDVENRDTETVTHLVLVVHASVHTTSQRQRLEREIPRIDPGGISHQRIELIAEPIRAWWFATWAIGEHEEHASGSLTFFGD